MFTGENEAALFTFGCPPHTGGRYWGAKGEAEEKRHTRHSVCLRLNDLPRGRASWTRGRPPGPLQVWDVRVTVLSPGTETRLADGDLRLLMRGHPMALVLGRGWRSPRRAAEV